MHQGRRLILYRLGQMRMTVAEQIDRNPRREIESPRTVFADQPGRPKPVIDDAPVEPVTPKPATDGKTDGDGIGMAAAGLLEAGIKFIESIASQGAAGGSADAAGRGFEQILSGLFRHDAQTNRPALSIPLPASLTQERLATAISGLVNVLGRLVSPTIK